MLSTIIACRPKAQGTFMNESVVRAGLVSDTCAASDATGVNKPTVIGETEHSSSVKQPTKEWIYKRMS